MASRPKSPGSEGEDLAVGFLRKNGYRILQRNYRCRSGEVDVIACEGDTLCFVEVKGRRSDDYGAPEHGVTRDKMRRMARAALSYLTSKGLPEADCRFDVVSVRMGDQPVLDLLRGAFTPEMRIL